MPPRKPRSIPLSLALGSLALSACATKPVPTPAPVRQIALTETLATSPCLRGLLPEADGLTVGGVLTFGAERHRDAICERERGDRLVSVIDGFNQAELETAGPEGKSRR